MTTTYELKTLTLSRGKCPFDEWFESLDREDQFMVDRRLARLRLGTFGEVNFVGDGVWELKFRKGQALRLYYTRSGRQVILLIAGGSKSTQKKDIRRAKELLRAHQVGIINDENS